MALVAARASEYKKSVILKLVWLGQLCEGTEKKNHFSSVNSNDFSSIAYIVGH